MRICLVTDSLPGIHPNWSGAEVLCERVGSLLSGEGHEVYYITLPFHATDEGRRGGVYTIYTPLARFPLLAKNLPLDCWAYRSFLRIYKEINPDVVHFHAKVLFLPGLRAAARLGIPTVFTVVDHYLFCPNGSLRTPEGRLCDKFHGPWCRDCLPWHRLPIGSFLIHTGIPELALAWRARVLDQAMRQLSAIVTLSETNKARHHLYGLPPEKVHFVYHFTLPAVDGKKESAPFSEPSVVYAGSICEARGPQVAVMAMKDVVREYPNAILRLIGPDEDGYTEVVRKLVIDLGLDKNVLFLGKKPNDEVLDIIRRSQVVIVPLQWPNEYGPVILLEAKLLGKPVVASRIGATPEYIEDGQDGFLVPPDRPDIFAQRITALLKEPEMAKEIGARASRSVDFLRGNTPVSGLITLYEKLLCECRSAR